MKLSGLMAAMAVVSTLVLGCSSDLERQGPSEHVASHSEALTTACTPLTIGLPCDPDGPGKPLLECEGVCSTGQTGIVTCIRAVANANDGHICGTQAGVGDSSCARRCSGKTCLAQPAAAGAACRPSASNSPCDGQCNGASKCEAIADACAFGRQDQLCKFDTCDLKNATVCKVQNLPAFINCSNDSACELGVCSPGGVCQTGNVKGCDDGNSCTDDECDVSTGGCIGTPNDANGCSDGNACTVGDSCGDGTCLAGAAGLNCDDNSACTTDGCDPNTGCFHQQKNCSDNDACTTDSCNPLDAECSHTPLSCDDDDPCTVDDCSPLSGCTHTPKDCSDGNACTTDSCSGGSCRHFALTCNDGDDCTTDTCDGGSGCTTTPVDGCGFGGEGGGGSGAGGAPGAAGEGSIGGSDPGAAGMVGVDAGAPSTGGDGPSAGATNSAAGEGQAPVGGEGAGATSSTGGTGNVGATSNEGGQGEIVRIVNHSNSCGCRTVGGPSPTSGLFLLVGAAVAVSFGRRRRSA